MTILPAVLSNLVTFAILAIFAFAITRAWVAVHERRAARRLSGLSPLPTLDGYVRVAEQGAEQHAELPRTFSGVDHEARYQAPEVLADALERERDARWVRVQRVHDVSSDGSGRAVPYDGYEDDASKAYGRSLKSKSLDDLRAQDMKALGIPCVRCGRKAEDHPEFPLCMRSTDVNNNPLSAEPTAPTGQAVPFSILHESVPPGGPHPSDAIRKIIVSDVVREKLPPGATRDLREKNFSVSNDVGTLDVHFHESTGQPTTSPAYPGPGATVSLQWKGQDYIEIPILLYARMASHELDRKESA